MNKVIAIILIFSIMFTGCAQRCTMTGSEEEVHELDSIVKVKQVEPF